MLIYSDTRPARVVRRSWVFTCVTRNFTCGEDSLRHPEFHLHYPEFRLRYRNFACGEDSHALRLTSKLVDLRAANADRILCAARTEPSHIGVGTTKKDHDKSRGL